MPEQIPLLICDKNDQAHIRSACHGAWMGFSVHHHFFAWQRDLATRAISARRAARVWDGIINTIAMVLALAGIMNAALRYVVAKSPSMIFDLPPALMKQYIPLPLAVLLLMFVVSRVIRAAQKNDYVLAEAAEFPHDDNVSWETVRALHRGSIRNIAHAWAPRAVDAFESTALKSQKAGVHFSLYTLFEHLLKTPDVQSMLIRLELPPSQVASLFHERFLKGEVDHAEANGTMWQVIAQSYLDAARARDPKVTVFHLFDACISVEPRLTAFFEEIGVQPQTLGNAIQWFRFMNHRSGEMRAFRKAASRRSTRETGAAMTGLATPLLNSIGEDITRAVQFGYLTPTVGRHAEIDTAVRAFESGASSVLLVGPQGVGKMSVIHGLAERMVTQNVPELLRDKRLIRVPITHIIAGTNTAQYQHRLMQVVVEAARAGNVVLAFEGIGALFGVRIGGQTSQDLSDTLAELLEQTRLVAIATATDEAYRTAIANSRFAAMTTKLDVQPVEDNDAIQILESHAFETEARHGVFFTYKAIEQCVTLARRFLQDESQPASALKLMDETAVYVRNKRGANQLIRADDVGAVVTEKTHVPITNINQDEKQKLLHLESIMHERIIGQDEAVRAVSAALRRARANVSGGKRPIATFLFLGPTGVGKTETAKTLADVYFGGEDRMTRFDMSEFQDAQSVYRLIGQPGVQGSGLLTEAIRHNPFTLLLLDEFEKADSGLLNVFLQVMDDGRLTDNMGRVVDFTNTIIIATSNAGAPYIQEAVRNNAPVEQIQQHLLDEELARHFRPELINRFDGVIVFTPLNQEQIEEIAHLMIANISKRLYEQQGVKLDVTERAVEEMAKKGYSPEYGARPMRRVVQSDVEDILAKKLLEGTVRRGQTLVIDAGGMIAVQ